MRAFRRPVALFAAVLVAGSLAPVHAGIASAKTGPRTTYVVLAEDAESVNRAVDTVEAAGGQVRDVNRAIGLVTASSSAVGFAAAVNAADGVAGVARDTVIGSAPTQVVSRRKHGGARRAPERSSRSGPEGGHAEADRQVEGAAGVLPVGHADDQHDAEGPRARQQGGVRRRHRHRHRRQPPGHRAQLQPRPQPQLHHRHPGDRRGLRRRSGRLLRGPGGRRTRTATAPTSPAPSPRRVNGIGIAGVAPERRRWSTSAPARTPASSSCSRRSTRSPTPATTASTWST